jgi:hypothetical protein
MGAQHRSVGIVAVQYTLVSTCCSGGQAPLKCQSFGNPDPLTTLNNLSNPRPHRACDCGHQEPETYSKTGLSNPQHAGAQLLGLFLVHSSTQLSPAVRSSPKKNNNTQQ